MVCISGVFSGGIFGCRQKQSSPENVSTIREAVPALADATNTAKDWVEMESLAPGKWVGIEGAADLAWNDETRIMKMGVGTDLNGVRWTGPLPVVPYTIEMEARRMSGSDFFCGLTFPVRSGTESVSLIIGGWGGSLVGISSIDGFDASENSTASQRDFENQQWYRIRLEVGKERLQAWIDDRQVVDANTEGQRLSLRLGPIEACGPFGLATWETSAEMRGVRWRKLAD